MNYRNFKIRYDRVIKLKFDCNKFDCNIKFEAIKLKLVIKLKLRQISELAKDAGCLLSRKILF